MTIFPPDIIFEMQEKGFLDESGQRDIPTEDCPEEYRKAWIEWQIELQKALKYNK